MTEEEKKLLKPVLWDTAIETVDLKIHKRSIIERIMVFGTAELVRWMLKNYSGEEIIAVIKKSKSLDVKTANFWAVHYNINKTDILCLNRQSMNGWF